MKKIGTLILAIGLVLGFAGCTHEPDNPVLSSIEIREQPTKTTYMVGEELDTTGMKVYAIYDTGSEALVYDWTTTGYDKTKAGEQTVEVSYTENEITKTTSFTVKVKEKTAEPGKEPGNEPPKVELTKIEITTEPTKKEYHIDDTIDLTGMVVTAIYNDGSSKALTSTEYTVTGFDSTAYVNDKEITVTYEGKTAKFTINVVFNWYETPVQLPASIGGTYGTEGTYVLFGVWPQDVVPEAEVEGLALDENAATTIERGYLKYVKGSDGNYYVKHESKWYKVMPIKWRVFDEAYDVDGDTGTATGKLLVAESILTANVPYYEDWENNRTIDGKIVYPNNYKYSQIRAYLNGYKYTGYDTTSSSNVEKVQWNNKGFLQTAFTSDAIDKIITTKVDNSEDSTTNYDTQNGTITKATDYACDPTDDKIFLLSEYEVTKYSKSTEAYKSYGTGNSRIRVTTDFAKANNAYQSTTNGYGGYWWLRSPYCSDSRGARSVIGDGDASSYSSVDSTGLGVVPALSISF